MLLSAKFSIALAFVDPIWSAITYTLYEKIKKKNNFLQISSVDPLKTK
jgi:hypothetical protein